MSAANFKITMASSTKEAIDILDRGDFFDVVVADVEMKGEKRFRSRRKGQRHTGLWKTFDDRRFIGLHTIIGGTVP